MFDPVSSTVTTPAAWLATIAVRPSGATTTKPGVLPTCTDVATDGVATAAAGCGPASACGAAGCAPVGAPPCGAADPAPAAAGGAAVLS